MQLGRKKTFKDQAGDYVDSVRPQVESALATAKERAIPLLNDARDKAVPLFNDARDKAAPILADARDRARPLIADGAAYAADKAAIAAEIAQQKAAEGAALASAKAAEGRDLASAKVAELKGEKPQKKRGRKLVLFTILAAGAALVAKKLSGGSESKNWQSSYTPAPPPAPRPAPTPAAPQSGAGAGAVGDDEGGASPDEALADAAQGAHAATTPDDPADAVVVDDSADQEINGSHKA
jgi:hypothetical protein